MTAAEVAAAEQRIAKDKAAAGAELAAAAARDFPKGTKVTWIGSDDETPKGAVGTVEGPVEAYPGCISVAFPKGTRTLYAIQLWRA